MSDARNVLDRLNAADGSHIDIDKVGDPLSVAVPISSAVSERNQPLLGESFAQELTKMAPGPWAGPINSSYGGHLVKIHERVPGKMLPLPQVHDIVLRDFMNERRREALDNAYLKLSHKYKIVVEPPEPPKIAEK